MEHSSKEHKKKMAKPMPMPMMKNVDMDKMHKMMGIDKKKNPASHRMIK